MNRPLENVKLAELLEVTEHTIAILKRNDHPVFTPWIIMEELAIRLKIAQALVDTAESTMYEAGWRDGVEQAERIEIEEAELKEMDDAD